VTDEECAEILYHSRGKPLWDPGKPETPPVEREAESEPAAKEEPEAEEELGPEPDELEKEFWPDEEEKDREVDWEVEPAPAIKRPAKQAGISDLLSDRVMQVLEEDIERMEQEREAEERKIAEHWKK